MREGRSVLALIPARGGSRGLVRKNVTPLAGRPLIAWTIGQALAATHVDRVVVTTDDAEIAQVARDAGAEVPFMRPAELATETSPTIDAMRHAIETLAASGDAFDLVALLEPTSPLRAEGDIDGAIEALADAWDRADSLISVGEIHLEHPSIAKRLRDGYLAPYLDAASSPGRRQDLEAAYFPYGVIYLSKTATLLEAGTFYQERTIPYFIERWQNYEVDDLLDLVCIEAVMSQRQRGGR